MMDRTLPAHMAASLAAALAIGGTGESYGLVLKGLNDFAAAAGATGAAAVASLPLTTHAHWAGSNETRAGSVTLDRTAPTLNQVSMGA
jgi:hypothetical protein